MRWIAILPLLLAGACADKTNPPRAVTGADADAGLAVMRRVGCASCHIVPGIDWPAGVSGPSLRGFADSPMIAGRFPNRPDVLVDFMIDAPAMAPDTGMPAMPLTQDEARNVAAYLYTLDE